MTALPQQHRGYDMVAAALAEVDHILRQNQLLTGLVAAAAVVLAAVFGGVALAALLPLSVGARLTLLIILLASPVAAFVIFLLPALLSRRTEAQVARLIEQNIPGLKNGLINTVQLAHDPLCAALPLTAKAIDEASRMAASVSVDQVVSRRMLTRWFIVAVALLAANLAFMAIAWDAYSAAMRRIVQPWAFVPFAGRVRIVEVKPGHAELFENDSLTITVEVENPDRRDLDARVLKRVDNSKPESYEMVAYGLGRRQFRFEFRSVPAAFDYYVQVGDSQTQVFHVTIRQRVAIRGIDATCRFPAYTGLAARSETDAKGPLEAPLGTKVELRLRLAAPAPAGRIETGDGLLHDMARRGDGTAFESDLTVKQDSTYAVVVLDESGRVLQRIPSPDDVNAVAGSGVAEKKNGVEGGRYYPIRAVADKPPQVFFVQPGKDMSAAPGSTVEIVVQGKDDYGVAELSLFGGKGDNPQLQEWVKEPVRPPGKEGTLRYKLAIDKTNYKEGDVISLQAFALDNRALEDIGVGGPQRAESNQMRLRVEDPERLAREKAERLAELRKRLEAILKEQVSAKDETVRAKHENAVEKHEKDDAGSQERRQVLQTQAVSRFQQRIPNVLGSQEKIHADLLDLGEKFNFDAELVDLKRSILLLAHNEAAEAVSAAKALRQVATAAAIEAECEPVIRLQQKIISVLESLLGVMQAVKDGKQPGEPGKLGGDLPPENLEKLRKLADELQRFLDEQKRVVKASAHLAKKPVDDYGQKELERLKELEAVADQWDKFLEEAVSDFSKMAEQDFSNPSMLQELIEIRDDVVMAKDALKKKAVEIAVPVEESGLEMAEELVTNIERWLPDEPDRVKWSMEEPVGEFDAPMAELPKELTDMVGDLLEEEEDLFEEMEDVTSAWTDSLDKGAGWDALDGPISNMSARGVTGNQLPNKSEISGRSGEGRTGKAVGEMVEDSATGKGGRRTPARLSPDAFQKGEVKDTANDPGGGATGGGKVGGLSGEGLEGPVPQQLQKELGRLAQKQASLHNKGEKINALFKAKNFDNFKLREALIMMGRAADDLGANRYQNALRKRTVILDNLNTTRVLLGGQIKSRSDESASMPKRDRDLISDAMKAELPKTYRQDVKEYLSKLSEQAGQ